MKCEFDHPDCACCADPCACRRTPPCFVLCSEDKSESATGRKDAFQLPFGLALMGDCDSGKFAFVDKATRPAAHDRIGFSKKMLSKHRNPAVVSTRAEHPNVVTTFFELCDGTTFWVRLFVLISDLTFKPQLALWPNIYALAFFVDAERRLASDDATRRTIEDFLQAVRMVEKSDAMQKFVVFVYDDAEAGARIDEKRMQEVTDATGCTAISFDVRGCTPAVARRNLALMINVSLSNPFVASDASLGFGANKKRTRRSPKPPIHMIDSSKIERPGHLPVVYADEASASDSQ